MSKAQNQAIEAALKGDRRSLARLLSAVENGTEEGEAALRQLFHRTGKAHIIGITGAPGAGKSTLVGKLARELRRRGERLAIVAVDPTSPYSGGALLGDRLRMRDLLTDEAVFIRSMASRGHPGGIAAATRDVTALLDAVGYPIILVETVGAGQAQVDVARLAHTVVLVEAPGMGDEIQALKAGLMEIADIIVVNKADNPMARITLQSIRAALGRERSGGHHGATSTSAVEVTEGWEVPILLTSAVENRGVAELADAIEAHRLYLQQSGAWETRLRQLARADVEAWLQRHLLLLLERRLGDETMEDAVEAVQQRRLDPISAAEALLEKVLAKEGR